MKKEQITQLKIEEAHGEAFVIDEKISQKELKKREKEYKLHNKQLKIAKKHDLKVIYDAAHAFGVKIDNNPIASYGEIPIAIKDTTPKTNHCHHSAACPSVSIYIIGLFRQ